MPSGTYSTKIIYNFIFLGSRGFVTKRHFNNSLQNSPVTTTKKSEDDVILIVDKHIGKQSLSMVLDFFVILRDEKVNFTTRRTTTKSYISILWWPTTVTAK